MQARKIQEMGGLSRINLVGVTKHDSITDRKRDTLRAH